MTIRRIQMSARLSEAVVYGGLVYIGGQVASPEAKETTVAGQTRLILSRIDELLAEAGTSKNKLLWVSVWLADIETFVEMNSVWDDWIPSDATPARATVEARLALPDFRVEIAAVAATYTVGDLHEPP